MNKHVPHVLVLPEDDANRQLALGFILDHEVDHRRIKILEVAGGWNVVLERFNQNHVHNMERNPNPFMVLLIDFDEDPNRLQVAMNNIPETLRERVFILGVWNFPERLRTELGEDYETIGKSLARDCRDNTDKTWSHSLLAHNASELEKMRKAISPILFRRT